MEYMDFNILQSLHLHLSGGKSLKNTCPLNVSYFECQGSNFSIPQKTLVMVSNVATTGPTSYFQVVHALK